MDFIANQQPQLKEMLQAIGISDPMDLFSAIPRKLLLKRPEMDDGLSEYEGIKLMERLASKNTFPQFENYLGAGSYEHHVPAILSAILAKSEFLTAYTPYQPEASQGMLQSIFEYQSAICALTGMDASNASVYDGASAAAEAVLMGVRHQKRKKKILIAKTLNPRYWKVVEQYSRALEVELVPLPFDSKGGIDLNFFREAADESTAAVLLQSPNFFGIIEDVNVFASLAKEKGALTILSANPISYGLFEAAGNLGIDIAVGDCQPFGIPMQFGGPYAGYLACKMEFVRQLPGRIVGETVDSFGKRGFVLTLQAREQHIRREKATSNICTNQALSALASLIAMLWYGKRGVKELGLANYQRAAYLKSELSQISGVKLLSSAETFNEFAVAFGKPVPLVQEHFRERKIEPGLSLEKDFPELEGHFLVAVTETKDKAALERYLAAARELGR